MAAEGNENFVGRTFEEFDAACTFIDKFLADGFHPCKHASRTTFAQFNKKIKAAGLHITDRPDDAVYSTRWVCKHFGAFKA